MGPTAIAPNTVQSRPANPTSGMLRASASNASAAPVRAPSSARTSPPRAPGESRASPRPMRLAPITASAMPQASARVGCSRSQAAAMPQAKTGLSDTRTTELATVVNRSDAIQDQKWRARRRPDNNIKGSRERGAGSSVTRQLLLPAPCSGLSSNTASPPVTGRTSASLQNAIARAGAAANRTIGPAYVVASTATMSTRRGDMGAKPHPPLPAPQPVAVLGRRPQIARSMRLRLALRVATLLPALAGGAKLAAQESSP